MSSFAKRVAILGSGFGTRVTAPALRAEGWEIQALFSRRPERAEEIATKLSIPHHGHDAQAVIARDDIDAVIVATPTSTHHEYVLAALQAGKHVLCEKPFATSLEQGRAMIEAAAGLGLTTMCNFEFRYSAHRLQISRLLADGLIGVPQSATATLYFPFAPSQPLNWRSQLAMGGGALNEHGSHYFDALRGWMGEVTSISAQLATHEPSRIDPESGEEVQADADDFVAATLRFASGAIANVSLVWSSRVPARGELYLTGPDGTISHRAASGLFTSGEVRHTPPRERPARRDDSVIEEGPALPLPAGIESMEGAEIVVASRRLLRDFERGIERGGAPSPNFEDGLRTQAMLDAARESSASGRRVEVAGN